MPGLIWIFHLWFWYPFVMRGIRDRRTGRHAEATVRVHPRSQLLIGLHTLAQALVYTGVWLTPDRGFSANVLAGAVVIQLGSLLGHWTLRTFRSWRVQAEIGASHHLQTDGPFRLLRNPIYMAMNLLNLGTLMWCPGWLTAVGFLLGVLLGDLRARAEEELLVGHFGDEARAYVTRVRRFLPGIY